MKSFFRFLCQRAIILRSANLDPSTPFAFCKFCDGARRLKKSKFYIEHFYSTETLNASDGSRGTAKKHPVSTRRRFNVHPTSITVKKRCMDVKTTLYVFWAVSASVSANFIDDGS